MAACAAFPFTFAQWKELERQAMIYKYMISSVPVPPDLLFPHSRNYSVAALDSPASCNVQSCHFVEVLLLVFLHCFVRWFGLSNSHKIKAHFS